MRKKIFALFMSTFISVCLFGMVSVFAAEYSIDGIVPGTKPLKAGIILYNGDVLHGSGQPGKSFAVMIGASAIYEEPQNGREIYNQQIESGIKKAFVDGDTFTVSGLADGTIYSVVSGIPAGPPDSAYGYEDQADTTPQKTFSLVNITLQEIYERPDKKFEIIYNFKGKDGMTSVSQKFENYDSFTNGKLYSADELKDKLADGFKFISWNTSEDGTDKSIAPGAAIADYTFTTNNITPDGTLIFNLYAQVEELSAEESTETTTTATDVTKDSTSPKTYDDSQPVMLWIGISLLVGISIIAMTKLITQK